MNNNNTPRQKTQVLDTLRRMIPLAEELDEAGAVILAISADETRPHILLRNAAPAFKAWARRNGVEATIESNVPVGCLPLNWYLVASVDGIIIDAFLTDEEKKAWDDAENDEEDN